MTSPNGNSVAQKFKYNGIELEDVTGLYEMDLRMYDPAIGRWNTIDPVDHYSLSTYNGMDNNPILGADPSGGDVVEVNGGFKFTGQDAIDAFNILKGNSSSSNDCPDGDCDDDKKKKKSKKENDSETMTIGLPNGTQVLPAKETLLGKFWGSLNGRVVEIDGIYYRVDNDGKIIGIAPKGGIGLMGYVGSGGLNILKFRGLVQNRELLKLTHQQLVNAFKGTGFKLSGHAIKRLKDIRTKNLGITTLNDFKQIINKGVPSTRGSTVVYSHKGMEVVVNPKTNVIITIKPANINPR